MGVGMCVRLWNSAVEDLWNLAFLESDSVESVFAGIRLSGIPLSGILLCWNEALNGPMVSVGPL